MNSIVSTDHLRYAYTIDEQPKQNEFSQHMHSKYEILYFISGDAEFVIGNMRHKLEPGELVLLPPRIFHHVDIQGSEHYKRIVLNFSPGSVPDYLLETLFESPKIVHIDSVPMLQGIFDRFEYYRTVFLEDDRALLFENLLTELIYLLHNSTGGISEFLSRFDTANGTLQNIIKYIERNLLEIEDIDCVCQDLFISRSYLHKLFTENLKISPMKYIKAKRLMLARDMIKIGEKPSNVAAKLHYGDYTSFFRAYKTFFGYAPQQTPQKAAPEETTNQ